MKILVLSSLLIFMGCSSKKDVLELPETIDEAVASEFRTPENMKRDIYRNPSETLKFFGLTPNMTVIEISPGAGWYMEILAPLLTLEGRYIMASPVADKPYFKVMEEKIKAWKEKFPMVQIENAIFSPPVRIEFQAYGIADMVLTFRNVHNWMTNGGEKEAFAAFYKVLKPGGILGVVEHRALPQQEDKLARSGYVREQDVIEMAVKAGFRLVATSEINANPRDTRNHPAGVWTLPPTLRLGEEDREKYLTIGESDRMTIKFMKPKN